MANNSVLLIKENLLKCEESIKINNYSSALQISVSIYGLAISYLFKSYLGSLEDPLEVLNYVKTKNINMQKCLFGNYIDLIKNTSFIEEIYALINDGQKYKKHILLDNMNELNVKRNLVVHPESDTGICMVDREFIELHLNYLKLFLKDFGLYSKEDFKITTKYETFNSQKIIGEVQLYESLNQVLNNEAIDCLDVTYFSDKIPLEKQHSAIKHYWKSVSDMLARNKLILRRIISFDATDKKGYKLLWFLFKLIPSYYDYLMKSTFLSVFRTNSSMTDTKNPKHPINLVNLILMYNRENPDIGHVWLFGSHSQVHSAEQEYIHLYGSNLSLFRKIYNDLFNSGSLVDQNLIKEILAEKNASIGHDTIRSFIKKLENVYDEVSITHEDTAVIMDTYEKIYSEEEKDDNGFEW